MKSQIHLERKERRAQILAAALSVAARVGYNKMTREAVAEAAQVSAGLVTHHMGTMQSLQRDVVREAIRNEYLPIIAQAIVHRDRLVAKICPELRARALSNV